MTAADLFDRAGRALYGDHYVAPMAFALKVEKTTVRNWAAGKSYIPRGVWKQVYSAIMERAAELPAIGAELRGLKDENGEPVLPLDLTP